MFYKKNVENKCFKNAQILSDCGLDTLQLLYLKCEFTHYYINLLDNY